MKLEVGPGAGRYSFRPHYCVGDDVVFLDVEAPEFDCDGISWVVGDAQHMPFRDSAFDEVFAGHVIEHLEDPLRFLRECRRVLRRGGRVTIVAPNFMSRNAYADPDHRHVFNFVRLMRLFRESDLEPHFPSPNIGSLLPRKLRLIFKVIFLLISDDLVIVGERT